MTRPVGKLTKRIREQQADTALGERFYTVTWTPGYQPTPEDEAALAAVVEAAWKRMDEVSP